MFKFPQLALTEALLQNDAVDLEQQDGSGHTPLHLAARAIFRDGRFGCKPCTRRLKKGFHIERFWWQFDYLPYHDEFDHDFWHWKNGQWGTIPGGQNGAAMSEAEELERRFSRPRKRRRHPCRLEVERRMQQWCPSPAEWEGRSEQAESDFADSESDQSSPHSNSQQSDEKVRNIEMQKYGSEITELSYDHGPLNKQGRVVVSRGRSSEADDDVFPDWFNTEPLYLFHIFHAAFQRRKLSSEEINHLRHGIKNKYGRTAMEEFRFQTRFDYDEAAKNFVIDGNYRPPEKAVVTEWRQNAERHYRIRYET